jgi:hypothetical protein
MAATPGALRRPDTSFSVDATKLHKRIVTLPSGTELIRAYGVAFPPESFNPNPAPLNSQKRGGRFDGTRADAYAFTYVAHPHNFPHVATWESLQNDMNVDPAAGEMLIDESSLNGRAFAYLKSNIALKLLDLRDPRTATYFGTSIKVLEGSDRIGTRAWSAYFRHHLTAIQGLIYRSTVWPSGSKGDAIVLYEDRCGSDPLEPQSPVIPMSSTAGKVMVLRSLKGTSVRISKA